MVSVVRVPNEFHARVVAARLGSEGIVTQLRGGVSSPYPMGDVEVLVAEADLEDARTLLLADEVESSFPVEEADEVHLSRRRLPPWAVGAVLALLALLTVARVVGYAG